MELVIKVKKGVQCGIQNSFDYRILEHPKGFLMYNAKIIHFFMRQLSLAIILTGI